MWSLEYALAGAPEQRGSLCCQCACESWRQIAHCLSQELNGGSSRDGLQPWNHGHCTGARIGSVMQSLRTGVSL